MASSTGEAATSASTALATSSSTALREGRSSVPPGIRVKWFQRKETVSIEIEVPDSNVLLAILARKSKNHEDLKSGLTKN